jgi:hypothetical protein
MVVRKSLKLGEHHRQREKHLLMEINGVGDQVNINLAMGNKN